jgi:hypothetical protein
MEAYIEKGLVYSTAASTTALDVFSFATKVNVYLPTRTIGWGAATR